MKYVLAGIVALMLSGCGAQYATSALVPTILSSSCAVHSTELTVIISGAHAGDTCSAATENHAYRHIAYVDDADVVVCETPDASGNLYQIINSWDSAQDQEACIFIAEHGKLP
jgi:hypothetical protein